MIVEYIRYSIAEDRREAFENAYAEAQTSLQASSHCLGLFGGSYSVHSEDQMGLCREE